MTLDAALRSAVLAAAARVAAEVSRSGLKARVAEERDGSVAVLVEDREAMRREYGDGVGPAEGWVFPALNRALGGTG